MNGTQTHFDLTAMLRGASRAVADFNEVLEKHLDLPGVHIDEIAYLFGNRHVLDVFTREAVKEDGCILFNTAEDHVHTLPLRTCYGVGYRFFQVPLQYLHGNEVRIEAMEILSGLSPLHVAEYQTMIQAGIEVGAIHASFKCVNEEQYGAVVHRLRERGWESPQRCESDYGRFSYWAPIDRTPFPDLPFLWLKPRVNTRDAS